MTKPTILVTGASGKTGGAVARELLRQGWPVRALVHMDDQRARDLKSLGAELTIGDLFSASDLRSAFQGVHRAYWCAPFHPEALKAAKGFAEAAIAANVESIVNLSQWLASAKHPSLLTRHSFATDVLFDSLAPGIAVTKLNPGFFADNYLRLIGFAAQLGILPSLTGNSRNAPPSTEDIARVAAACLMDPVAHAGRTYRPTGPELLSTADMARIIGSVLSRRVIRMEMPMWLFVKAARMQGSNGAPPFELSGFQYYIRDHKAGAFERGAPTNDVLDVTGRPPEAFQAIAARYAVRPETKRSLQSIARAWFDFMRTPMMPGYDLAEFERSVGAQPPERAVFAMNDAEWLSQHH